MTINLTRYFSVMLVDVCGVPCECGESVWLSLFACVVL